MEIHVRPAETRDYDELCALYDEVDALHRDHLPQLFQKPVGPARQRDYLASLMASGDRALFVAAVEGRIAGVIHVLVQDTPPIPLLVPRRVARVQDLVVGHQFRRRGIGRALMQAGHQWAVAQGATTIELTAFEFNRDAIDFYQALGYQTLSRTMSVDLSQPRPEGAVPLPSPRESQST